VFATASDDGTANVIIIYPNNKLDLGHEDGISLKEHQF
jgi:hypothetical protein